MSNYDFYTDKRYKKYVNNSYDIEKLIEKLIEIFGERCPVSFKVAWRDEPVFVMKSPKAIRSKVTGANVHNIVTVRLKDNYLGIEVFNGFYNVNNLFEYTLATTDNKMNKLFDDISSTLGINFIK